MGHPQEASCTRPRWCISPLLHLKKEETLTARAPAKVLESACRLGTSTAGYQEATLAEDAWSTPQQLQTHSSLNGFLHLLPLDIFNVSSPCFQASRSRLPFHSLQSPQFHAPVPRNGCLAQPARVPDIGQSRETRQAWHSLLQDDLVHHVGLFIPRLATLTTRELLACRSCRLQIRGIDSSVGLWTYMGWTRC